MFLIFIAYTVRCVLCKKSICELIVKFIGYLETFIDSTYN